MSEGKIIYAGFRIRVLASLIDSLLLIAVTYPPLHAIYGNDYFNTDITGLIAGPADFLIAWVLPAVIVVYFWMSRQATPGKIVLSLRIVDAETGGALTWDQSIARYVAYFIAMLPFLLGLAWVAVDMRKQGWHDKLARTVVIRVPRRGIKQVRFPRAQPRITRL